MNNFLTTIELVRQTILGYEPVSRKPRKKRKYTRRKKTAKSKG